MVVVSVRSSVVSGGELFVIAASGCGRTVRSRTRGSSGSATAIGGRLPAGVGAVLIDEVAHGAQVRGVLGQCGGDGRLERGGAVADRAVASSPRVSDAQVRAALGGAQEQRLGAGAA